MRRTRQRGFSVVEALIILLVVSVLGFTGWYVYHTRQTSDNNSGKASNSSNSTAVTHEPNPYAGWKIFCSGVTTACFRYDPTWTFAECTPLKVNLQDFQNCAPDGGEMVLLISPDKMTMVSWSVAPYDPSAVNQCTQGRSSYPGVTYTDITQVPNVNDLYYVHVTESPNGTTYIGDPKYDNNDHLSLVMGINGKQPTVGQAGALCPPVPSFLSKDGKYELAFRYDYTVNTSPNIPASERSYPPSQTASNAVKQTLLSFYYK